MTLNFNQLRKRVSAEDYFIDFKFECTSTSSIRCSVGNQSHLGEPQRSKEILISL